MLDTTKNTESTNLSIMLFTYQDIVAGLPFGNHAYARPMHKDT